MRFKARLFSTQEPAADSSMISAKVAQEYFASEKFKQALKDRKLFGTLTHMARNLQACKNYTPALSKTIGKDDNMLLDLPMTHILTDAWLEDDGWAYGEFEVLDKSGLDDEAVQKIKRLEGLLKNGCHIGISCVIVGYWNSENGHDYLKKLVELKGADLTLNPSWKNAGIVYIEDDQKEEKTFSELDKEFVYSPEDYKDTTIKVKQFSVSGLDIPKSSKIDGLYTQLKVKEFSFNSDLINIVDKEDNIEKQTEQKEFTQVSVKDRLRECKMSPRMYFRRMIISYKQVVKSLGGADKISEQDKKILQSLLTSDVLYILGQISSEIINKNKQINTLLGCSSISKNLRIAAQSLQVVYRMAGRESQKMGFVSKMRYQKLQAAWNEFVKAVIDEVFGENHANIPSEEESENIEEGK